MSRVEYVLPLVLLIGLSAAQQSSSAPQYAPFLRVDINGAGTINGSVTGPTASGFEPWDFIDPLSPALTNGNFVQKTFGNVTVKITVHTSEMAGTRNRNFFGSEGPLPELHRDFLFIPRPLPTFDAVLGLERFEYQFDGLSPNTPYEFTFWSFDFSNIGTLTQMAYSVTPPTATYPNGYVPYTGNLPLGCPRCGPHPPTEAFSILGNPSIFAQAQPYDYSASFWAVSDNIGAVTIHSWNATPVYVNERLFLNEFNWQYAAVLNGFAIGTIPEPNSFILAITAAWLALHIRLTRRSVFRVSALETDSVGYVDVYYGCRVRSI